MSVIRITKDNFEAEVLRSQLPVLLDFSAKWCGPCRMLAPTIEAIADERADSLKVGTVDIDAEPELADAFRVSAVPFLAVMKGGKLVSSAMGLRPKAEIEKLL